MVKLSKDYFNTESWIIQTRLFTVIISPYIHSDVLVDTVQSGSPWDGEQPPHEHRIFRYSEVIEPNITEPAVFGQPLRCFRVEPVQVSEIWGGRAWRHDGVRCKQSQKARFFYSLQTCKCKDLFMYKHSINQICVRLPKRLKIFKKIHAYFCDIWIRPKNW